MASFVGNDNISHSLSKNSSLGFVAPEIFTQSAVHTFESDMFSAGLIMHVLLTGNPVFTGSTDDEIQKQNMRCDFQFDHTLKVISDGARDLIQKILVNDPK